MYTRVFYIIRHDRYHDTIEFPHDELDFFVQAGYLTPDTVKMYVLLVIEVRNGVMW